MSYSDLEKKDPPTDQGVLVTSKPVSRHMGSDPQMALQMGPYTQLLIRRTAEQRPVTVKVLEATAERLGWLDAFPVVWSPEAQVPGSSNRRAYGTAEFYPAAGGRVSGVYLASKTYPGGGHPRLRFRITGPWTRSDLSALRSATVPEIHAITAGALRWRRPSA